jgi:hypothetical protein
VIVGYSIEQRGEVLAQIGVRGFGHNIVYRIPVHIPNPFTIEDVSMTGSARLERVLAQLLLYEHPLLNFSARAKGEGVEVVIQFKDERVPVHTYYFDLHPRDLDDPQFEWSFQRQLYDALHDYFVEMFIRTPQDRADRRSKGL